MADNAGILLPATARRPSTDDRHPVALSSEVQGAPQSFASFADLLAWMEDEPNLLRAGMPLRVLETEPDLDLRGGWTLNAALQPVRAQAALEEAAADLKARTALLEEAQTADRITVASWDMLSALDGTTLRQGASVPATDGRAHTDPVSGQPVTNAGLYSWTGTAWQRIGDTPEQVARAYVDAVVKATAGADATVTHTLTDRYGALVAWLLSGGVLTAPQLAALERLGVAGLGLRQNSDGTAQLEGGAGAELLREVLGGLRLGGNLTIGAGQAGYVLSMLGRYGALDWLLYPDGTTSEGRANAAAAASASGVATAAQAAAAVLAAMLATGGSDDLVRVLGRYGEMVSSFDRSGVLRGGGVSITGGADLLPSARADYSLGVIGRYGDVQRAWLPDGREVSVDQDAIATGFSAAEIAAENARAISVASARRQRPTLEVQPPDAGINIVLVVGQSLLDGLGAYGGQLLSAADISAIAPGLMMLGDSEHRMSNSAFPPFGGVNVLKPLAATVVDQNLTAVLTPEQVAALDMNLGGARGESPGIAAAIIARRMWLDTQGVPDDGKQWVVLNCSVSSQTIEQLSYGGPTADFNVIIDAVTRMKALADAAGKTCRVALVVFGQGEYNYDPSKGGTQDRATYLALLEQYRTDIYQRACVTLLGQSRQPLWVTYQTGAGFTNDSTLMSIGEAQRDFAAAHPGMVVNGSPHYDVTNRTDWHLDHMGSRWLGCRLGRAAGTVLAHRRTHLWVEPLAALRRGRQVLTSCLSPWPKLQWATSWRENTAFPSIAQRGFELVDDAGQVPVSVDLVGDVCVAFTAARDFVGPVWLQGAPASKFGMTNLFDADPTVFPLSYTYTPANGQLSSSNIADLVDKPFPARTPCAAFRILTTPV